MLSNRAILTWALLACFHLLTGSQPIGGNVKFNLKHRSSMNPTMTRRESLMASAHKDLSRIQTINGRKNRKSVAAVEEKAPNFEGRLVATLESGVSLGSGEYFIDVYIGTPPRHFSLILDTGSDLNWLQCLPCRDCFEQRGPVFDPAASSSYRGVNNADAICDLVSSPVPSVPSDRVEAPCPYYYWYGDESNTTGDLAVETFTVNLTAPSGTATARRVKEVVFGCGHWNRGLFHGAAGLLGLGRGPLSFSSQLRSLYGHMFSYCLVDRNSDLSVSSKLVFGEDQSLLSHPNLNYTTFVSGNGNATATATETFYYIQIKGIVVGGKTLDIPAETWEISTEGSGGAIIDSGTTLSYFANPAYGIIREAFVKTIGERYPAFDDFPLLSPCYNVSGMEAVKLPEFAIVFGDGAVWSFPAENYFIRLEPEGILCLAILGAPPRSSLSIIGNYQQQNFHILYDIERSRLGFAPVRCSEVSKMLQLTVRCRRK